MVWHAGLILLVLAFFLVIVPRYVLIAEDMLDGTALPTATRLVFGLSALACKGWFVLLPLALFLLTVLSTLYVGGEMQRAYDHDHTPEIEDLYSTAAPLSRLLDGWPFAVTLLGILLAHELGHFFAARHSVRQRSASKSASANPALWRVFAYSAPGFPNPTMRCIASMRRTGAPGAT